VVSFGLAHAAVSVLIVDSEARPKLDPAILRELFSLTPAEARVTAKLGGGWSAEEIAEELGVSLETIRTHIRRILSKTATARQGQLISLVLRTAPFSSFYKETPHIPNSGDASPPS
jgi:DNA-binding CsgD family transcriptional regulator